MGHDVFQAWGLRGLQQGAPNPPTLERHHSLCGLAAESPRNGGPDSRADSPLKTLLGTPRAGPGFKFSNRKREGPSAELQTVGSASASREINSHVAVMSAADVATAEYRRSSRKKKGQGTILNRLGSALERVDPPPESYVQSKAGSAQPERVSPKGQQLAPGTGSGQPIGVNSPPVWCRSACPSSPVTPVGGSSRGKLI